MPTSNNKAPPSCQFLRDKVFKKKPGQKFIEQTIELELRGFGLPGRTCNSKTGYFDDKQCSSR